MRLAFGLLALLPPVAHAEGAVQQITCTASATCDAAGACLPGGDDTAFRLAPLDVNEFGAGTYELSHGDVATEAVMRPDMSLIWAEGRDDLQMLTLLDTTSAIWVRRTTGPGGRTATVTFVTCGEGS